MTTKTIKAEQAEALDRLREELKPGTTVWTILRKVSKSGMSREIDVVTIEDDSPFHLSGMVHAAGIFKLARNSDGLRVTGTGMDMGFHVVYSISRALYPDGFNCTGDETCPSNDHFNEPGYNTNRVHSEGGYALKHRWL